jgi:hypothetical protein
VEVDAEMKKSFKIIVGIFGVFILIIIVALIVDISNDKPKKEETKAESQVKKSDEVKTINWEEKVKEVAASNGTETEKFDQISLYAKDYQPSKKEVTEFEQYIIKEYKDKKYIKDISNAEYMLGNIFKADVIQRYYDDKEQNPIDSFAFDFWQNSKYNYRKVDTMTSESTLSNERQMDKALVEIEK